MEQSAKKGILSLLGQWLIDGYNYIVDITTIVFVSIKSFLTLKRSKKAVTNEILYTKLYRSIRNTSGIVGLVSFVLGALIVTQVSSLNLRMDVIGTIFDTVIIKELGPLLTTVIVTGRSAAFITTEISAMKKTNELVAFTVMGIDPKHYVMMPRVVAVTIALIVLILLFDICCVVGGLVMTFVLHNISPSFYLQNILSQLSFVVIIGSITKGVVSGLLLTSVSCYHGFAVKGSFVEMPGQVAKSFVGSLFFCFISNFVISYLLYL